VQLGREPAEVLQRSADRPSQYHIKSATGRILVHGIKARALTPAFEAKSYLDADRPNKPHVDVGNFL